MTADQIIQTARELSKSLYPDPSERVERWQYFAKLLETKLKEVMHKVEA